MKRVSLIVILLLSFSSLGSATEAETNGTQRLVGTVVAAFTLPLSVYHPCAAWLIVRLKDTHRGDPQYVQVAVIYFPDSRFPNNGFPSELVAKAKEWEFEAARVKERDAQLNEFLKGDDRDIDNRDKPQIRSWILLPGAENEQLPFGRVLSFYEVTSNRYKPAAKGN